MTKSRSSIKRGGSHNATSRKRTSKQSKQQRRTSRRTSRRMNKTKNGGFKLFGVDKKDYVKEGLDYLNMIHDIFNKNKENDKDNELVNATEYFIKKINEIKNMNITYEPDMRTVDEFIHGSCKTIIDIQYFYIKLAIGLKLEELKDLLNILVNASNISKLDKYTDSIKNTARILYTINTNKNYIDQNKCAIDDKEIMQIRETLLKESQ